MINIVCDLTGCFGVATKFAASKYHDRVTAYCSTHFRYCFCGHLEKSITKEDYLARLAMEAL